MDLHCNIDADFDLEVGLSGRSAGALRFRYSTKYWDAETGLYYYGERFYSPPLRRWLNRDPIEERGGLNLYSFCSGNPVSLVDFLGARSVRFHRPGESPSGGWLSIDDKAFFVATFRIPRVFRYKKCGDLYGFTVVFDPNETIYDIYYRHCINDQLTSDELEHADCADIYDTALDVFKKNVENILDVVEKANQKLQVEFKRLQDANIKCRLCNSQLDDLGGKHGH